MTAKEIIFDEQASFKIKKGFEILAKAVGVTLGPKGKNVAFTTSDTPTVTKDGVTVSKEIDLDDPFDSAGAQLLKYTSLITSDTSGYGTTTATILAYAIYSEGLRQITAGASPIGIKRGLDILVEEAVEYIEEMASPISTPEEIAQIATISANNEPYIGDLISEAMQKVGKDGVITVEESKTIETFKTLLF